MPTYLMSHTAALAMARNRVYGPTRRSPTDYIVTGPYRDSRPYADWTEVQRNSWWTARELTPEWRARVAACAMLGRRLTEDESYAARSAIGAVRERLNAILPVEAGAEVHPA